MTILINNHKGRQKICCDAWEYFYVQITYEQQTKLERKRENEMELKKVSFLALSSSIK